MLLPPQTLHLHIGADLHIPVRDSKYTHPSREEQQQAAESSDPFDGLPLRAWAEKLGERVMPAYELIKEEQEAAKKAARAMGKQVTEMHVPNIPHVLPFTRWCALPHNQAILAHALAISCICPFAQSSSTDTACFFVQCSIMLTRLPFFAAGRLRARPCRAPLWWTSPRTGRRLGCPGTIQMTRCASLLMPPNHPMQCMQALVHPEQITWHSISHHKRRFQDPKW